MHYSSTRGHQTEKTFQDVVMAGLANDGGLFVPNAIPDLTNHLGSWKNLSFQELCYAIFPHYVGDCIPTEELHRLIDRSYATFSHPEVTPVVSVGNTHILELFHGPTFAFKDVALQFLGNLFEYFLSRRQHPLTVVGATSGDTGSAAIYGLRGKENIQVFILHPKGRISQVQEKQMTSVLDNNIHNLAIEGTFDDAQAMVKQLFADEDFKQQYHLGAVNSINWARILAQMVYYFYAYFRVQANVGEPVVFSVPTGNFGDVLAGYYAKKMGLPIQELRIATNHNDILFRCLETGEYKAHKVEPSHSPAMDIQVSSNFERLLYAENGHNATQLSQWMQNLTDRGSFQLDTETHTHILSVMSAKHVSDSETLETIKEVWETHEYLLDPHTAVGFHALMQDFPSVPSVCLATAHPAKFEDAIQQAIKLPPKMPSPLADLANKPTRSDILPASVSSLKKHIENKIS